MATNDLNKNVCNTQSIASICDVTAWASQIRVRMEVCVDTQGLCAPRSRKWSENPGRKDDKEASTGFSHSAELCGEGHSRT